MPQTGYAAQPGPIFDPALLAAQQYLDAVLRQDYDAAAALLCSAERDDLDAAAFQAQVDRIHAEAFTADGEDLRFSLLRRGTNWAQVSVTGEILVYADQDTGLSEPQTVTPAEIGLAVVWPVLENSDSDMTSDDLDGAPWTVCTRPPAIALPYLEPDLIAQLFLEAAFGGDYASARALVCRAQAGVFTEANYAATFQDYIDGTITVRFDEVVFVITGQDDDSTTATVRLTGALILTQDDWPGDLRVPAEQFNAVPLIFEDGWKVCQVE
ncbi:MAG: hypothetical protein JXQ72_12230 [Anaerolineae bacterium]|nr:hypothetical protein [Anaerolineae bacterium]